VYELGHRSQAQDQILDRVHARCAQVGSAGFAVFDLDGCLFDNRPRQVQIVRVWASRHDAIELLALEPHHLQDWSMSASFRRLGLGPDRARELADKIRPFWERWFFDDAYVGLDRALPGAARFVRRVAATGVRVAYLTGRLDRQRPSTLLNLARHGFPIDDAGTGLITKPEPDESDRAYKRRVFEELAARGRVVSFLDNEPTHVNFAHGRFPEAVVVWVRTDHSPGTEPVLGDIPSIHGYLRSSDPELRGA